MCKVSLPIIWLIAGGNLSRAVWFSNNILCSHWHLHPDEVKYAWLLGNSRKRVEFAGLQPAPRDSLQCSCCHAPRVEAIGYSTWGQPKDPGHTSCSSLVFFCSRHFLSWHSAVALRFTTPAILMVLKTPSVAAPSAIYSNSELSICCWPLPWLKECQFSHLCWTLKWSQSK